MPSKFEVIEKCAQAIIEARSTLLAYRPSIRHNRAALRKLARIAKQRGITDYTRAIVWSCYFKVAVGSSGGADAALMTLEGENASREAIMVHWIEVEESRL